MGQGLPAGRVRVRQHRAVQRAGVFRAVSGPDGTDAGGPGDRRGGLSARSLSTLRAVSDRVGPDCGAGPLLHIFAVVVLFVRAPSGTVLPADLQRVRQAAAVRGDGVPQVHAGG
uniref:(northern house mosquito) hypothetical protein n=1 Tax=Culex pipiens TaxID=7175 RepID=A0A8D8FIR0_CULPI